MEILGNAKDGRLDIKDKSLTREIGKLFFRLKLFEMFRWSYHLADVPQRERRGGQLPEVGQFLVCFLSNLRSTHTDPKQHSLQDWMRLFHVQMPSETGLRSNPCGLIRTWVIETKRKHWSNIVLNVCAVAGYIRFLLRVCKQMYFNEICMICACQKSDQEALQNMSQFFTALDP